MNALRRFRRAALGLMAAAAVAVPAPALGGMAGSAAAVARPPTPSTDVTLSVMTQNMFYGGDDYNLRTGRFCHIADGCPRPEEAGFAESRLPPSAREGFDSSLIEGSS